MTRRVLNRIRLDKIAAVDAPCQEHATAAIVKRAPVGDAPPAIAKKTFAQALNAQLVSEKIGDTFWRAFEKQWAVREAFRVALTDEIADGGDGEDAIADFTAAMNKIAGLAAEAAREAAEISDVTLETAVEQAITKWLETKENNTMKITTKALLKSAVAKFNPATSTVAELAEIQKAAVDLDAEDMLPADGPLAKVKPVMDEEDKKKVKGLEKQVAVLSMSPDVRKHYDALPEDAQDAFIAKSDADRQAEISAASSADPVLYKCKDGTEIRKSDGTAAVLMAKRLDEQDAEIAKLRADGAGSAMAKRASSEFPHVAEAEAVDMLKAAAALGEDSDAGRSIVKTLKAMNKARGGLFKSLGTTEAPDGGEDTATALQEFNAEVEKVRTADKVGLSEAMSKGRTAQPELFKRAFPESVDEGEDA